ncbi:hypothetical protein Hanom_Chr15g01409061 [Helianthus anomalus]
MNEHKQTYCRTFTNVVERTRPLFLFVHLVIRTKFLVRVCLLLNKRTSRRTIQKLLFERSVRLQPLGAHIYNIPTRYVFQ